MSGTGQSGVCAQVLLSTYDGHNYRANLADLGGIDLDLLNLALMIIRGRAVNMIEPHEVVKGGRDMFDCLRNRWPSLAIGAE
ncbi:hypothetical protein A3743_26000 [Oleiphilus sp. HI0072]|nr:hypothetical protein A3743_26000 [Oleiphilus sp. HI0072]